MKWMERSFIALSALTLVSAPGVSAQRVESIMRAAERLELTEDQLESLEALRREAVDQRTASTTEMEELRSQLDAGLIRPSDLMAAREDRRDEMRAFAEEQRARLESILTEEQLATVRERARRGGGVRESRRPDRGPRFDRSGPRDRDFRPDGRRGPGRRDFRGRPGGGPFGDAPAPGNRGGPGAGPLDFGAL